MDFDGNDADYNAALAASLDCGCNVAAALQLHTSAALAAAAVDADSPPDNN